MTVKAGQIKAFAVAGIQAVIGRKGTNHLLLARAYRQYVRAGVIFIHVPKCAGTSVSSSLYGKSLGHHTARELRAFAPERFDRQDSFAVLREPVERAFSAYLYLLRGGTRFGWAAHRPEYEEESFKSFERFATEWLPGRQPDELDFTLRPQSRYVTDERGDVMIDRLLPLDRLKEEWPDIIGGHAVARRDLPALNEQEVKPPPSASAATKAALRTFYAADVALWESIQPDGDRSDKSAP